MESAVHTETGIRPRLLRLIAGRSALRAMLSGVVTVAALTLVAKAASFVKDAAVAHRFGTSDTLDAFLLSFSFLAFLASVVGGGLPEAFLPVYAALRYKRGARRAHRLAVQALVWNIVTFAVVATVLFFAAPHIIEFTDADSRPRSGRWPSRRSARCCRFCCSSA